MVLFQNARVRVKEGWLQGSVDGKLKIFKGIPYAAPPIGERRFRLPEDPVKWRGIKDATRFASGSIQKLDEAGMKRARAEYSEDCLYLNVWTPAESAEDKLPVFLWIHGGGLVAGAGWESVCDGSGFAGRKDIVVVSINYRLGLFGFFAHPELTKEGNGSSGNYGLYDMRKACQWVKENIAQFGGDPERITIAGQSGGAAATSIIHVSPLMEGLASQVSIESGPVYWGVMQPLPLNVVEQRGVEFWEKIGCTSLADFRSRDAWELFDTYADIPRGQGFVFCIDGKFLPEKYETMVDTGRVNDFTVMIGSCAQELVPGGLAGIDVAEYQNYLSEEFGDDAEKMRQWYPAETTIQAARSLSSISSDYMYISSLRLCHALAKCGKTAYTWQMNKETENQQGRDYGSPHCAEMPYVFGTVDKGGRNPNDDYTWLQQDYDFMNQMQSYWYHLTADGDPNCEGLPEWKPYSGNFDIMRLGNDSHMLTEEEQEKYRYLWRKLDECKEVPRLIPGTYIRLKGR